MCGRKPSDAHHLRFAQPRRLAERSATNSSLPCAGFITGRSIVPETNVRGGSRPASTRSVLPVSYGGILARAMARCSLRLEQPRLTIRHRPLTLPSARHPFDDHQLLSTLAISAELFHTADGTAFADIVIDGHRETWPVHSARFRSWVRRQYYEATGSVPAPERSPRPLTCLRPGPSLKGLDDPFTSASRSMTVASTSISPTTTGALSGSAPMGGG